MALQAIIYAPCSPRLLSMQSAVIRPVFLCWSPERGCETPVYGLAVTSESRPNFCSSRGCRGHREPRDRMRDAIIAVVPLKEIIH